MIFTPACDSQKNQVFFDTQMLRRIAFPDIATILFAVFYHSRGRVLLCSHDNHMVIIKNIF